jgi:hypothetical protein
MWRHARAAAAAAARLASPLRSSSWRAGTASADAWRGAHAEAAAAEERATIFALSTAPGRAAIAVVRASGPAARAGVARLLRPGAALPADRTAALVSLRDPEENGALLDQALLLLFAAPRSATGEDVAELHLHGGAATVAAVLAALSRNPVRRLYACACVLPLLACALRLTLPHLRRAGGRLCRASSRGARSTRACLT